MNDLFRIDGQRALVTGANTGIGRAIACSLAERGAHVLAAGRSSTDDTVEKIKKAGGSADAFTLDLSNPAQGAGRLAEAGEVDILINNAGIIRRADAVDFAASDWADVLDVNLTAVFLLSQAFAKAAIARGAGGRIVNIASLLSFQGGIRVPAYTASKHGVAGLTKALANEWATSQITVNAIAPGYIATNNTEARRNDPARAAEILGRIPAGRWGAPEDIGGATAFLCTPAAGYITGAMLNVDGGWLAR